MRKLLVIFALFLSVLNVYADIISANNVTLKNGETTKLDITLENAKADIVGLQFNLVLPEGVTPVIEEGDVKITPSNRLNGTYVVRGSKVADGSYLFTFLSSDRTPIQGNNGTLFSILLRNDNAANGDYTATLYGVTTTNLAGQEKSCPNESFSVSVEHKYKLTYYVDGTEYKSIEYIVGSAIYPIDSPSKEGYTFSGWSNIPSTMPASDVTVTGSFSVNSYKITYIVDGQVYSESFVGYGTNITPLANLSKEGYTFSGWSNIPSTMPATDVTVTGSFSVNSYKITYIVDGQVYSESVVAYGTNITPLADPSKEGYTFSGWSNIPSTMPASDVTVTGSFSVNSYKITYIVDGQVYSESVVAYGTNITPLADPTKDGYNFSGWSYIPDTMPNYDVTVTGTFSNNSYKITYIVDGQVYSESFVEYGSSLSAIADPSKEGYTFSGWSNIPSTMPASDVTVTGSFSVNSYKISYIVDGQVYSESVVVYGTDITPLAEPSKEGYTFSGWSSIPSTMPASDVTVTGSFNVNTYVVTYIYEGQEVGTQNVVYGEVIPPYSYCPDDNEQYTYTFEGWADEAGNPVELTIMPAHDVVVYAIISVADGISGLTAYGPKSGIYALSGAQICGEEKMKDVLPTLPKGLYIINGKVYMKR